MDKPQGSAQETNTEYMEARKRREPRYAAPANLKMQPVSDEDQITPENEDDDLLMLDPANTPGPARMQGPGTVTVNEDQVMRYLPSMARMAKDPRTPRSLRLLYQAVIDQVDRDERGSA